MAGASPDVVVRALHDTLTFAIRDTILVPYPDTVWAISRKTDSMPEAVWGLVGVGLGFGLHEIGNLLRRRGRIRRLRKALRDECESLVSQLPDLIDLSEQMVKSLRDHRILPGPAVRGINTVYSANISELAPHLTLLERNLLHVVHERVKVGDQLIADHAREVLVALQEKMIPDPWGAWVAKFEEQIESYRLVEQLLQSFLAGTPDDVFRVQVPPTGPSTASR